MSPAGPSDCVLNEAFQKGSKSLVESSACFELVYQRRLEQYWDENKAIPPHEQTAGVVGLGTSLSPLPVIVISSLAPVYTNLFKARRSVPTCRHALSANNYIFSCETDPGRCMNVFRAVTMTWRLPSGAYTLFLHVLPDVAGIGDYIEGLRNKFLLIRPF